MYTCKCKGKYCGNHMHDHNCTYDHLKDHKQKLKLKLPVIKSDRGLVKI